MGDIHHKIWLVYNLRRKMVTDFEQAYEKDYFCQEKDEKIWNYLAFLPQRLVNFYMESIRMYEAKRR